MHTIPHNLSLSLYTKWSTISSKNNCLSKSTQWTFNHQAQVPSKEPQNNLWIPKLSHIQCCLKYLKFSKSHPKPIEQKTWSTFYFHSFSLVQASLLQLGKFFTDSISIQLPQTSIPCKHTLIANSKLNSMKNTSPKASQKFRP